jgi:hypothetical protein
MNEQKKQAWQALQHFYKMKSVLLPEFLQRNRRNIGSIESELIREWENKTCNGKHKTLKSLFECPHCEKYFKE